MIFFISLYSPHILFTEANSFKMIVFNLVFPNNIILLCFFYLFLIIFLYFLIPTVIAQTFNSTAQLVVPTRTATNEGNAEIETQPLIAETKTRKERNYFKAIHIFFMLFIN